MSPHHASRTAQHARRLLTARILTPHDYAVFDALLWRCRRPGHASLIATYQAVARLAGVCRDTAISSVRKLADLGILAKARRRVRVMWGRGELASRQAANCYEFRTPDTESATPPAYKGITRIIKKEAYKGFPHPPVRTVAEQIEALRSP
jgi:hypothetical protein